MSLIILTPLFQRLLKPHLHTKTEDEKTDRPLEFGRISSDRFYQDSSVSEKTGIPLDNTI